MTTGPRKNTAVLYLRCSTDKQEQSIGDQRRECARYAEEHALEIIDQYVDDGISGTSAIGRPEFLRMIEDAGRPDCRFRHILVYDIKRFGRMDTDEVGHFRYLLRTAGVELHYVTEGFTGGDTDEILRSLKQNQARQESRDLSKVTIRGQVTRASDGNWTGGLPPWGYDLGYADGQGTVHTIIRYLPTGKKEIRTPDGSVRRVLAKGERMEKSRSDHTSLVLSADDRVALVRRIFELYAAGDGYKNIADRLNTEGIPSPRSGNYSRTACAGWSASTIKSLLDNRVYTGAMVWNRRQSGRFHCIEDGRAVSRKNNGAKTPIDNDPENFIIVEDAHPAIIDREQFEHCQRLQRSRRKGSTTRPAQTGRARSGPYLLSGLIRCGHCEHSFIGQTVRKGKRRADGERPKTRYYQCGGYTTKGRAVCTKAPVRKEELEAAVIDEIRRRVRGFLDAGGQKALGRLLRQSLEPERREAGKAIKRCEGRIAEIEAKIDRLLDNMGETTREFIEKKIAALKNERDGLFARRTELCTILAEQRSIEARAREIIEMIRGFDAVFAAGTVQEKRAFIAMFVESITVHPDTARVGIQIRKFPTPQSAGTGNLSFRLVAGTGFEPATFGL